MCDVPGYGVYSNHDTYLSYVSELQKKSGQNVKIEMVVLGPKERKEGIERQFGKQHFEDLNKTASYDRFLKWDRAHAGSVNTMEAFEEELARVHTDQIVSQFSPSMDVHEYNSNLPVYLWVIDDRVGFFSIPNLSRDMWVIDDRVGFFSIPNLSRDDPKETAFVTRDPRLIEQLKRIFETYWRFQASTGAKASGVH
ncbi:MAG: hypothetical protein WAQ52_12845 [Terriglobales bacterium]